MSRSKSLSQQTQRRRPDALASGESSEEEETAAPHALEAHGLGPPWITWEPRRAAQAASDKPGPFLPNLDIYFTEPDVPDQVQLIQARPGLEV